MALWWRTLRNTSNFFSFKLCRKVLVSFSATFILSEIHVLSLVFSSWIMFLNICNVCIFTRQRPRAAETCCRRRSLCADPDNEGRYQMQQEECRKVKVLESKGMQGNTVLSQMTFCRENFPHTHSLRPNFHLVLLVR